MGRDGAPPGGATPLAGGRRAPAPIGCRSAFDLHTAGPRSRHARVEARRAALKGTALGARGAGAGAAAGRGPSGGGGRAMGPPRCQPGSALLPTASPANAGPRRGHTTWLEDCSPRRPQAPGRRGSAPPCPAGGDGTGCCSGQLRAPAVVTTCRGQPAARVSLVAAEAPRRVWEPGGRSEVSRCVRNAQLRSTG